LRERCAINIVRPSLRGSKPSLLIIGLILLVLTAGAAAGIVLAGGNSGTITATVGQALVLCDASVTGTDRSLVTINDDRTRFEVAAEVFSGDTYKINLSLCNLSMEEMVAHLLLEFPDGLDGIVNYQNDSTGVYKSNPTTWPFGLVANVTNTNTDLVITVGVATDIPPGFYTIEGTLVQIDRSNARAAVLEPTDTPTPTNTPWPTPTPTPTRTPTPSPTPVPPTPTPTPTPDCGCPTPTPTPWATPTPVITPTPTPCVCPTPTPWSTPTSVPTATPTPTPTPTATPTPTPLPTATPTPTPCACPTPTPLPTATPTPTPCACPTPTPTPTPLPTATPTPTPPPVFSAFWVTDETDDAIYRYSSSGTLLTTISLNSGNGYPRGIAVANSYVWVADKSGELLYKYTTAGTLVATTALHTNNTDAEGIYVTASSIYVVDGTGKLIYIYGLNGTYQSTTPLHTNNAGARGITTYGNYTYVVDDGNNSVYVYNGLAYSSVWSLSASNDTPEGITTDGSNIWVADRTDSKVFKYTMAGAYVSSFDLDSANNNARDVAGAYSVTSQPIVFDSASSGASNLATASMTVSHTVATQNNRVLVVGAQSEDASSTDCKVASMTYNGQSLTKVNEAIAGTSFYLCTSLWYLVAPATGIHDIVVNWTGSVDYATAGGMSLYNVAQLGPEAQNSQAINSGTTISTSITTFSDGAWVVDAVGSGNPGAFTPTGSGQTERYDVSGDTSAGAGSTRYVATHGAVSMSWSQAANRMAQVLAAFAPA